LTRTATSALALVAALGLAVLAPRTGRADEVAGMVDGDDGRAVAKAHFEQGRAFQDARAYERAIIEYQAAYAISPQPELLFNIGQCYRLGGQPRSAVLYYQRYLQLVADGGASDEARAHVATLRRDIAAHPQVAGLPIASPDTMPGSDTIHDNDWRWVGAGSVIAGLTLGAVGMGLAYAGEPADSTDSMTLTTVAAALVTAGGVTWWVATRPHPTRRFVAAPVTGNVSGVAIAGSF
jgi:tetratricopeptide (TPR) repeat protein